ncbi:unnamed protein product [Pylaiella littoralis]
MWRPREKSRRNLMKWCCCYDITEYIAKAALFAFLCPPRLASSAPLQMVESEVKEEFIKHMANTLDWGALCKAASEVGMPEGSLPPALTPELLEDSSFLEALHRVLMDMHVVEGALVCPETGRRFPIAEGVPNLMCTEDEVR